MKKLLAILITLVLATGVMAYFYFSKLNEKETANDVALQVAANNGALVFNYTSSKDFYNIMREQDIFSRFLDSNSRATIKLMLGDFTENSTLSEKLNNQQIFVSLAPDSSKFSLLFCTQFASESAGFSAMKVISGLPNCEKLSQNQYLIKSGIYEYFIGLKGPLLIASPSKNLVSLNLNTQRQASDAQFQAFMKERSRVQSNRLMTLYVNFGKIPDLINRIRQQPEKFWANLADVPNFGELDYNFSKEKLIFHGTTLLPNAPSFYGIFAKMKAQKFFIQDILPASTANYTLYAVNSYTEYATELHAVEKREKSGKEKDVLTSIKEKYLVDLPDVIRKNFKNQFMVFQLNTGERLGAIALSNGEKFAHSLVDLGNIYSPDISVFKDKNVVSRLFGEPFREFHQPFYTVVGNYLVFANNASTVQSYLNLYATAPLLNASTDYAQTRNEFPSDGNISIYINLRYLLKRGVNNRIAREGMEKFTSFNLQFAGDNGKFQTNVLISKKSESTADSLSIN